MTVKPNFFDSFCCIADKCTDTCCAGWEIDVDEDTYEYYCSLEGDDGEFLRSRLTHTEDGCVRLCHEGERCPFLREDNLCEMIIRLGEDSLCDICREHPRFYSGSENITEVGVGLCCEEAARLWLETELQFIFDDSDGIADREELDMLKRQMSIVNELLHGERSLGEILCEMLGDGGSSDIYPQLRELYRSLDMLDKDFGLRFNGTAVVTEDKRFRNLAAYFVYRWYFELGQSDALLFTTASLIMISAMNGGELYLKAKDYSKEIEYDTDNPYRIVDFCKAAWGLGELAHSVLVC